MIDAGGILGALARLIAPPRIDDPGPSWLLAHQREPFRRLAGSVACHGGALLALPVGTGKTYLALAVAGRIGDPIDVVGPAVLAEQWGRAAAATGLSIRFTGHERLPRGARLGGSSPVIVDECHRFRNPATARYRALAPMLAGRPVILVTATPVVNRLEDLAHQLALAVPDDVLWLEGVPSLGAAIAAGRPVPALGRLVVTGSVAAPLPDRRHRTIAAAQDELLAALLGRIDELGLSRRATVAALIRTSLCRAAGSSPAALVGSLERYRRLLDHARAAKRGGHPVNRAAIRAVIGDEPEQLVLWDVLEAVAAGADLALTDGRRLEAVTALARRWLDQGDAKLAQLRALLQDGVATVVFASSVDTVDYLRRRLGIPGVAWITGARAGIGTFRAGRGAVLGAFRPGAGVPGIRPPTVLLASDVAAEGLDLQRAARVVHYDLPWTAVRLAQRDGRVARQGSTAGAVELIRFEVPPAIEARIGLAALVRRKAALPGRIGLVVDLVESLDWGARVADRFGRSVAVGRVGTAADVWLAGVSLRSGDRSAGLVLTRRSGETWQHEPIRVDAAMAAVRTAGIEPIDPEAARTVEAALAVELRTRLAALNAWALFGGSGPRAREPVQASIAVLVAPRADYLAAPCPAQPPPSSSISTEPCSTRSA